MEISDDFGSCHTDFVPQEWLYREEFEKYEKEGVLQMHTAFSREQATIDGLVGLVGCCHELSEQVPNVSKGVVVCVFVYAAYTWLHIGVSLEGTEQCRYSSRALFKCCHLEHTHTEHGICRRLD